MTLLATLIAFILNPFRVSRRRSKVRISTIVMHVSVTAILFLSFTQYLAQQILGWYVTGPIVLLFTVIAICGAGLSGHVRVQWGPALLILFLGILAFRNIDELTPLTQEAIAVIAPVIVLALCVRIDVRILLQCMAAAGFVFVVVTALNGEFLESRLILPGVNPIWMARIGCLTLLSVVFTLPTERRSVSWAVAAALTALMWLTGSRGPFLAAWSAVVIFKISKTKGNRSGLLLIGTIIATLISVLMLGGAGLPTHSDGGGSTEWRLGAWQQAFQLWLLRPVLGYGVTVDAKALGLSDYPHNAFIELLLQAGALGLGILAVLLWLTWRHIQSAELRAIFVAVLIFSAFSGSVWDSYELWLFALIQVSTLSRAGVPHAGALPVVSSSGDGPVPVATESHRALTPGAVSP